VIALLASGCFLGPSDPADTTVAGARAEGETIVVKIPLCPSDELRRVEVTDWDKAEDTVMRPSPPRCRAPSMWRTWTPRVRGATTW
jgi:hypothetical protein